MNKDELNEILYDIDNDDDDINYMLLKFLITNSDEIMPISTEYQECNFPYGIYRIINKDERIETNANEVPLKNGKWIYNNHNMYEYIYMFIDNRKLLVIEIKESVNSYIDEPKFAKFTIFPMAEMYSIHSKDGHRDIPYFNIMDENGHMINKVDFEILDRIPNSLYKRFNGELVKDTIKSVSIRELINRYQDEKIVKYPNIIKIR